MGESASRSATPVICGRLLLSASVLAAERTPATDSPALLLANLRCVGRMTERPAASAEQGTRGGTACAMQSREGGLPSAALDAADRRVAGAADDRPTSEILPRLHPP